MLWILATCDGLSCEWVPVVGAHSYLEHRAVKGNRMDPASDDVKRADDGTNAVESSMTDQHERKEDLKAKSNYKRLGVAR